jgi:membrane fusion protein, multidrug efflux system
MPERVPIITEDAPTGITVKHGRLGGNDPSQTTSVDPRVSRSSDAHMSTAPTHEARARPNQEKPIEQLNRSATVSESLPKKSRRLSLRTALSVGGILVVAIVAFVIWLRGGRYASTDDAYVQAAKLVVSTDVSGIVAAVDVHEGQTVKAGEVLFQLDTRQFQIAVDNATALLAQTGLTVESMKQDYKRMLSDIDAQQAQVALDQVTFDRSAKLEKTEALAEATYDQARYSLAADQAKLQSLKQLARVQLAKLGGNSEVRVTEHPEYRQVKAQVDEAQRQLDHSIVRAPFGGIVTQVDALQPGTFLSAATAPLTNTGAIGLVSNEDLWIDAFMKETDLTYVRPGNHVDITVDTYPGRTWSGTVQTISPASASQFSILPAQNASGNWVKVVQRIPVRIGVQRASTDPPLRSGMSVTVSIDTGHRRSLSDLF